MEPASAYFYAQKMGMTASCFDIVDACMSWIRALDDLHQFFKSGRYKRIMIANGEFNIYHGFPDNFKIQDLRGVEYTFPPYTIGEAASATILSASDAEWKFVYKSVPALADLCTIPMDGFDNFVEPGEAPGQERPLQLRLLRQGPLRCRAEIPSAPGQGARRGHGLSRHLFPARGIGFSLPGRGQRPQHPDREDVHGGIPELREPRFGEHPRWNGHGVEIRKLKRGDKVVFCPASAGMVYSAVQFVY